MTRYPKLFLKNKTKTQIFARLLKDKRLYIAYIRTCSGFKCKNEICTIFRKYGFAKNYLDKCDFLPKGKDEVLHQLSQIVWGSFAWSDTIEGNVPWRKFAEWLDSLNYGK